MTVVVEFSDGHGPPEASEAVAGQLRVVLKRCASAVSPEVLVERRTWRDG